ncbi:AbrB/MazE/SpoVT family DNA-binding domain-containing protein [Methanoplanus endosymbiosus]|uniref:AbrB/MazE/SpoVT family DNA-binding domain-containing protein n=1 Tax=Methanoplanus endosymbiosus TaxID=33865 RepID=A0A9E7TMV1_9EURY|nr:AbrB/MazE/SpoVT family DNA-binding domain-containing protein [Methanoplanus endosymbiosus]UUX93721.1 AbrB/MazE/SpoVT family DNA-binding domain-containing protein [Methanoplanus endosymbiosus]
MVVTLPKEAVLANNIQPGDKIAVFLTEENEIRMVPLNGSKDVELVIREGKSLPNVTTGVKTPSQSHQDEKSQEAL